MNHPFRRESMEKLLGRRPTASPASGVGSLKLAAVSTAPAVAVAFTVFVWALSFSLIKIALAEIAPLPLAAARFAVASLLVAMWLAWRRPALPTGWDMLRFLCCGLIGIALYNALFNAGQRDVSASAASFIVNTSPILTGLFAALFLDERFTRWGWAGALLGFAGVAGIVYGQPGGLSFGSGALLVFGAAVAQAGYFVLQKPLVRRYGALTSTAYTVMAGTLLLSPWLGAGVATLGAADTAPIILIAVVLLGVFPAALGYAAWSYALGHYGAARASAFLYLVPPVATLLAFLLAGERPAVLTILGGLIAISGVALVGARGRPAPRSA